MKKTTKWILIGVAAAVALVVAFNLLPDGIRIASTISAGVGFVAGIVARAWYDRETKKEEAKV
ncbi:hypothetical protein [Alistipes megaguti]|uniref:hypothetical protein n=1 Tax=Alistipes megaguti TaxID=2364787 RepID=UPI002356D0FB|nr:hypothetical protein [Alistipes megaguti]